MGPPRDRDMAQQRTYISSAACVMHALKPAYPSNDRADALSTSGNEQVGRIADVVLYRPQLNHPAVIPVFDMLPMQAAAVNKKATGFRSICPQQGYPSLSRATKK